MKTSGAAFFAPGPAVAKPLEDMSPVQESPPERTVTLIDELLAEQRSLTAVARFARLHEAASPPAQARFYRDLIPLSRPKPGEQYAFEVNLDQCSGCKGCVTACHALNGLDEDEAWRDVGLLVGGVNGHALQQTVTTACHHCVDPGCLNGCPVIAYEKDPTTGIVRHLDDQCIGCQYCVMKCPYDVPKYSERLGIVRKCDLCHQRLAVGEAPACVQACPNEAIKIGLVNQSEVTAAFRTPTGERRSFLPASPSPDYTVPTTRYLTGRPLLNDLRAADEARLRPEPPHRPLVFMLVLSQASVGLTLALWLSLIFYRTAGASIMSITALVLMAAALGIASLHLGRPLKAWRTFLGWRTSWFSREAIAFGGYLTTLVGASLVLARSSGNATLPMIAVTAAAALGLVSVYCSIMLYADTQREFWSPLNTTIRFGGSVILLGLAGWLCLGTGGGPALFALALLTLVKLALEAMPIRHLRDTGWTPLKRTASLLAGPLRGMATLRIGGAVAGGVIAPLAMMAGVVSASTPATALALIPLAVGELMERQLFFTAVSPVRMPGGLSS
jgi:Fe-S-cluster-containing dehydrogenase component/DMSO reductase anchor subunit